MDYDPLPVVTDPERALEPGAPLTHPDLGTNVAFTWSLTTGDDGELDKLFAAADRVVSQRIVHQRLTPMAMEPRGLVASYSRADQALTLWTSTQIPHLVRTLLPGMIGVPENRMRIVAPEVGGGFGSKLNLYVEEALCSHLSMRLNAPIKWIESAARERGRHHSRPRPDRRLRDRGQERRPAAGHQDAYRFPTSARTCSC